MKKNASHIFLSFLLLYLGTAVFSQGGTAFEAENTIAAISSPVKKTPPAPLSVRSYKRFPALYNGLAIEIATSTYPMDKTNPIFRKFGNVHYEKLSEGGYSYLIMANFSSKESALDFVQNVVKPKAEKARLIQFSDGNRKVIRE
ncbi:MAG: hypothetical protein K9J37_03370 [Saprospiraceae bacterium]|nr:hypothetical protein [Saprospiraceae bacterium]MCF8248922.1 hypothetical protein [Saprospiraceae bacterium]MCF8279133.1 hypothetical protein [Bacteroidales bacterium]MCF8310816.1 hypothetical protein [Saprospiraceae bacterium]MCF8439596.1 hypothetical protein [Saprospiraceae bacterium]